MIDFLLITAMFIGANDPAGAAIAKDPPKTDSGMTIRVASKGFTENDILANIARFLADETGNKGTFRALSGSAVPWKSLQNNSIDVYPDYTGTITHQLLKKPNLETIAEIRSELANRGVGMTDPLGFANNYAIGMTEKRAAELGITKISQLKDHPNLRYAFSFEFMKRQDGWPTFSRNYELTDHFPDRMEHIYQYKSISEGTIDVIDIYSTDAKVGLMNLRVLKDDYQHFPEYQGVYIYRLELEETAPAFVARLKQLGGAINNDKMVSLNVAVEDEKGRTAEEVGASFVGVDFQSLGLAGRIWKYTKAHLLLVLVSLSMAIVVAVPLGVVAAKVPALEHVILVVAEIIQTIPGLALLVLLMPLVASVGLPSIGPAPAIAALFLYSLLPIIRNTHTGMRDIPNAMRESAAVLGLTPASQLWQVELPMASRMILAGIKTTAAINVGYATLGGLIGAGGYGQPIMTGLQTQNTWEMLEGAIPAAVMALGVKVVLEGAERFLVPKGLLIASK